MSDETAIRQRLEERARAIGNKDAPAALRYYSDDVVNFDFAPPLAQRGPEATDPAELQGWFDTWDGPSTSHSRREWMAAECRQAICNREGRHD